MWWWTKDSMSMGLEMSSLQYSQIPACIGWPTQHTSVKIQKGPFPFPYIWHAQHLASYNIHTTFAIHAQYICNTSTIHTQYMRSYPFNSRKFVNIYLALVLVNEEWNGVDGVNCGVKSYMGIRSLRFLFSLLYKSWHLWSDKAVLFAFQDVACPVQTCCTKQMNSNTIHIILFSFDINLRNRYLNEFISLRILL